ncbi:MAG: Uncharacterized protein G01um101429_983 [Parcubacteria group bacterium Gr01-1014_29]|nr:MAG: Uncharacterized protein G01um101429_983 [Parcubacteria group bacterium Gr01-1014_29]
MAQRIIDLKHGAKSAPLASQKKEFRAPTGYTEYQDTPDVIEWSMYEYELRPHGSAWFFAIGVCALILVVIGILAKSYFFIIFVALAFFLMVVYAKRAPREIHIALTSEGVITETRSYPFTVLKSFCVFEKGKVRELSLETIKYLQPYLRIPLGEDTDSTEIRQFLARFLPEEEHEEFISDQITRKIGL